MVQENLSLTYPCLEEFLDILIQNVLNEITALVTGWHGEKIWNKVP